MAVVFVFKVFSEAPCIFGRCEVSNFTIWGLHHHFASASVGDKADGSDNHSYLAVDVYVTALSGSGALTLKVINTFHMN